MVAPADWTGRGLEGSIAPQTPAVLHVAVTLIEQGDGTSAPRSGLRPLPLSPPDEFLELWTADGMPLPDEDVPLNDHNFGVPGPAVVSWHAWIS